MHIKKAEFVISNSTYTKCPNALLPEYAFIGRSNVGKSSLINMLIGRKKLAKISSTPGKTQLINHFIINDSWYLVDLPGYGYAKTSKVNRSKWTKMISDYLLKRKNLLNTFILIDSRLSPQKIDLEFIEWMGINELPFIIVFTKIDKINKLKQKQNIDIYVKELHKSWEELPDIFISSAVKNIGKEQILDFIEKTNKIFIKPSN
ncbi:MAG: YihA family ribosome biogenesis GTP-binding protein [Bacteroidales bacterium]|nr:YihA family ribosome biogenesis GTP-binding protein [Bacteroidales bacterium]